MNVLHAALYSDTSINKYYEKKALLMRITQLKKKSSITINRAA